MGLATKNLSNPNYFRARGHDDENYTNISTAIGLLSIIPTVITILGSVFAVDF